jgi:anoctamin-10
MTAVLPTLSTVLTRFAERLTESENYQTNDAHQAALVQKIFFINFITSYMPLFLTAFVYMPFGNLLVPYLDVLKMTAEKLTPSDKPVTNQGFHINPDRLKKQIIYFTVTAQVVNLALEVVVPYVKRQATKEVEKVQTKMTHKKTSSDAMIADAPEEHAFLERVRNEADLDIYEVAGDYREMVVQFGMPPLAVQLSAGDDMSTLAFLCPRY